MGTPAPRLTTARLLQVGDIISVSAPGDTMHMVTITALDDDEPNRRILITVRNDETCRTGTVNAAPGDKFDRLAQPEDLRETVIVDAADYWKWMSTHITHPNTGHRVMVRDVQRAQHPKDGREIVAIVPANGPLVFSERTGHLVFEDN